MTLKLTAASFLAGVKQSGLIEPDRVDSLLSELLDGGIDCNDSVAIATAFVDRQALTEWQSEKLLQGRHKGFLLGRYRLLSLLGAGEMSAVYLAEHIMMERRCAIKVLPANKVQDTSYLGRFHREARAVAAMNHLNIVRAYDVDKQTESGTEIHFLVMEYVEGRNLEQIVKDRGPLDYVTAVDTIRQAADGLGHAHQLGMVHRDVKPGNLLIDNQGIVKLLDLGLARFFKSDDEESLTIKHDEKVLGTADYLAPEQAIDSHQVDARADIYSLGCTLYFALTGHPPFTDGTLVQRLLAHQTKTPQSVSYERPDVDASLLAILGKMMAKKTVDRYQSALEVSEALSRWLIEHAPTAWKQKHMMLVAALCGIESLQVRSQTVSAVGQAGDEETNVLAPESMAKDRSASDKGSVSGSGTRAPSPKSSGKLKPKERPVSSSVRLAGATSNAGGSRPASLVVQELASKLSVPVASVTPASIKPLHRIRSMDEMTRTVLIGVAMLVAIVVSSMGMFYFIRHPGQGNNAKIEKTDENKGSPTTQVVPVDHRPST
ncbi:MAG: serine/threonine protein kinase [Candidatus Saccharimonas sp.]|nr:serine/threonine protein kinase [Planctomycetaceae bacterium]